jgi:hypothetical protein
MSYERNNMASNLLYKYMFMRKYYNKITTIFLIVFISVILGYALRMHHEGKIKESYQSQAEKDLATLEEEFYSSLEKPRSFIIFNGMFEVYPVSKSERTFYYHKARDSGPSNLQVTENVADNENNQVDTIEAQLSMGLVRNPSLKKDSKLIPAKIGQKSEGLRTSRNDPTSLRLVERK